MTTKPKQDKYVHVNERGTKYGAAVVCVDDQEYIVLYNLFSPYEIEVSRINTPEKLAGWIDHLSEKIWFERELCRRLTRLCDEHFDMKLEELNCREIKKPRARWMY
jgi:hypothetical protein